MIQFFIKPETMDFKFIEVNPRIVSVDDTLFTELYSKSIYQASITLTKTGHVPSEYSPYSICDDTKYKKAFYLFCPITKAGKCEDNFDFDYFENRVAPHMKLDVVTCKRNQVLTEDDIPSGGKIIMYGNVIVEDHKSGLAIWEKIRQRLRFEIEGDPVKELL